MADNLKVIDGQGDTKFMRARDDGNGNLIPVNLPLAGNGIDHSPNPIALPGGSPTATIAADPLRAGYLIQNQDAGVLTVVLDDDAGALTRTIFVLAAASGPGLAGGSINWAGVPHNGRIRIWTASGGLKFAARVW